MVWQYSAHFLFRMSSCAFLLLEDEMKRSFSDGWETSPFDHFVLYQRLFTRCHNLPHASKGTSSAGHYALLREFLSKRQAYANKGKKESPHLKHVNKVQDRKAGSALRIINRYTIHIQRHFLPGRKYAGILELGGPCHPGAESLVLMACQKRRPL